MRGLEWSAREPKFSREVSDYAALRDPLKYLDGAGEHAPTA